MLNGEWYHCISFRSREGRAATVVALAGGGGPWRAIGLRGPAPDFVTDNDEESWPGSPSSPHLVIPRCCLYEPAGFHAFATPKVQGERALAVIVGPTRGGSRFTGGRPASVDSLGPAL